MDELYGGADPSHLCVCEGDPSVGVEDGAEDAGHAVGAAQVLLAVPGREEHPAAVCCQYTT